MTWERIKTRSWGGAQRKGFLPNLCEEVEGDLTVSSNLTILPNTNSVHNIRYYKSLTVNSGQTLTFASSGYTFIFVEGDCNIQGTLTCSSGASAIATAINYLAYDINGLGFNLTPATPYAPLIMERASAVTFTTPAVGAAGGASVNGNSGAGNQANGNAGSAGTGGQTGGGGSGAGGDTGVFGKSGIGGTGTAFSGGAGSGAGSLSVAFTNGQDGGANGGKGGDAGSSASNTLSTACGGGAGNPGGTSTKGTGSGDGGTPVAVNGQTGTGSILILVVGGVLTIGASGVIKNNGFHGGNVSNNVSKALLSGGGSGGGRNIVLSTSIVNSGSVTASGGAGGTATSSGGGSTFEGGAGGAGSVLSQTIGP